MADPEEASVAGFSTSTPTLAEAIIKRTNIIGSKEACGSDADVQNVVQCLVSLRLSAATAAARNRRRD